MAYLLGLIFVLSAFYLNVNGYSCPHKTCVIDCTETPERCSNSVIDSKDAILLNITCNGASICNNLQIHCPNNINSNTSNNCNLICNGNNGCNNIEFYTFNSNSSSIQCGNQPNITTNNNILSICSNIIISSSPNNNQLNTNTSLPNITMNCYHSATASTCQNISFQNIVSTSNVFINCNDTTNTLNHFNTPCNNFTIKNNKLNNFNIYSYYGIEHIFITNTIANTLNIYNYNQTLHINIDNSNEINELNINNNGLISSMNINNVSLLMNHGIISNSNINQFHNLTINSFGQLLFSNISSLNTDSFINIHSSGNISSCNFNLIQDINHINNSLTLHHSGLLMNNIFSIHGYINIISNGTFKYNLINLTNDNLIKESNDFMNILNLKLNESSEWINNTINAYYTQSLNIETLSLFSGVIYTNNKCNNFSLQCNNKFDIDNTCKNLTLYTAPINGTYLNCVGYGCQYITLYSLNGLNDIDFSATECPCTVDCIDNCIGNWNIYCSNKSNQSNIKYNIHSIFQPNSNINEKEECLPEICCGNIVNESEPFFVCQPNIFSNVVCKHNVGLDIALIASLGMAAVITFFFIFLGVRHIYRKFKKDEQIKQFEKQKQMEKEKRSIEKKKRKKIKSQKLKKLAQNPLLKNDNYGSANDKQVVTTINGK